MPKNDVPVVSYRRRPQCLLKVSLKNSFAMIETLRAPRTSPLQVQSRPQRPIHKGLQLTVKSARSNAPSGGEAASSLSHQKNTIVDTSRSARYLWECVCADVVCF